ncbi:uncharacterized protein LOC115877236 [Sitophilus oryzae]|uniref:Uncharacterized protein LOC115877236 n=1 Tax=Sitophilus oryzae TaxID=7048 RepID=A0A6J2XDN3_SITOR|nr:uncharacterized protein LOC115877236 [Sitophilus oryzae]
MKRQLKNLPSGSGGTKDTWPLNDIMGFLDPHLTTRRTSCNYGSISSQASTSSAWDSLQTIVGESDVIELVAELDDDMIGQSSSSGSTIEEITPTMGEIPRKSVPRSLSRKRNAQDMLCEK